MSYSFNVSGLFRIIAVTSLLTVGAIASLFAQHRADLRYFDEHWNPVTRKEQAKYYRKIKDADSVYLVQDYYATDTLYMQGFFSSISPNLVHHGKATWFYPTGLMHRTGYFKKGQPVGFHKEFHENGRLKGEILFDPKQQFHLSRYDENGNSLLQDGYGVYTTRYMDEDFYNEVFDHQLLRSYYINEKGDTIYGAATKPAQFVKGGLKQFYKNLRDQVEYPYKHRKIGTDGTVLISFIIDERGDMTDLRVIKSLGPDFDPLALRVVRRNRDWKPAMYNAKPVPMRFVVPVSFLNRLPEYTSYYTF